MYALYHEVIEKGLRPLASEPLFTINKNTDLFGKREETFVCCIPLEPDDAPEDALILKGCRAFSCLCYGSYDSLTQARILFRKKLRSLASNRLDIRVYSVLLPRIPQGSLSRKTMSHGLRFRLHPTTKIRNHLLTEKNEPTADRIGSGFGFFRILSCKCQSRRSIHRHRALLCGRAQLQCGRLQSVWRIFLWLRWRPQCAAASPLWR